MGQRITASISTRTQQGLRPTAIAGAARTLLRLSLTLGLTSGLALAAASPAAYAQGAATAASQAPAQPRFSFKLAPASLDQTLNRFAGVAGIELAVDASLTAGKTSAGLNGSYTVAEGFAAILAGHGLQALRAANGYYALERVAGGGAAGAANAGAAATVQTMASITVSAQIERSATTEGRGAYAASVVTMGRGEQALKEIPQSLSVLTRQRMDDQGISDLRTAANSVTGVVGAQGVGPGVVISARGFQIDQWQYDGVPMPRNTYALGNWATEGMAFNDRMEVLRGAAGLLQGTGSPGGAVNLVRKRGQAERSVAVSARAGSWDRYGLQLDAGGPLNAEGTLRGRVVLDEDRSHSFVDTVWSRNHSAYAALDYELGRDTNIGFGLSRVNGKAKPMLIGLPRYAGGGDIGLPRSTYTGAVWNHADSEQTNLFFDLNHRLDDKWSFKFAAIGMNERNSSAHQRMAGVPAADGSGVDFGNFAVDFDSRKLGFDTYLRGSFDALALEHTVMVGANYARYKSTDMYARTWSEGGNIFNIDHQRPWQNVASIVAKGGAHPSNYAIYQKGLYATWSAKLAAPLTAVLGGRLSWYDELYATPDGDTRKQADSKFTSYAGLIYALDARWNAYASYADVFEPQSERTAAGAGLDPISGKNYELGLKGELFNGRVNASAAVYRYEHSGRAVQDLAAGYACDGWYCSRASGKVRSQGAEAELSGELLRHLQLFAGYTYTTTKFLSDPVNQDMVFSTWAPKHMLRLWADYKLPATQDKLSVGAGLSTQSNTLSYDRSFKVAGFTTWNARLGYQFSPQLALGLNLNNLFDKRYYLPSYSMESNNNYYGEPRSVMLSLKYTPQL
ncbi:TonB-dependent siderophore receptor [Rugamonas sp. CCM 8940]|nr:TonB-dependent siderophore receptor [Rugamonas sp. CCM 8940]